MNRRDLTLAIATLLASPAVYGQDSFGRIGAGGGGGGTTLPVADTQTVVKGSGDATKLIRFEVDGITTGTTRILTINDADYTLHGLTIAGTWAALQKFPDNLLNVVGSGDATKIAVFEVDGITTGTTRTVTVPNSNTTIPIASQVLTFSGPTAARTITLPDGNTTVPSASQLLTFAGPTASRTLTLPDSSFTVAGLSTANAFTSTNSFVDGSLTITGSGDATKLLAFEVDGFTTGTTRTATWPNSNTTVPVFSQIITFAGPTAARTVTLPDSSFTVAGLSTANAFSSTNSFVDGNLTVTGSSDATKILQFEVDGFTTGTTRTITPPNANTTLPIATQVLTFSGPTAARTITLPDSSFTVAGLGTTNAFSGANSFVDGSLTVTGSADATKIAVFEVDGITTGTTRTVTVPNANTTIPVAAQVLTLAGPTAARTITFPDASDTVAEIGQSQTFSGTNLHTGREDFGTAADAANAIAIGETTNCITFEGTAADGNEGRICGSNGGIDATTNLVYVAATQTFAILEGAQTFTGSKLFNVTINYARTITAGGTTGAQTINLPAGTVNFAAAATTIVVTNSLVTANSIIFLNRRTNDATCLLASAEPAAGSFTIRMTAACTAETSVGFLVTN